MNFDLKALERQLYSDGYRLAVNAVKEDKSPESIRSAVVQMHRIVDDLIDAFISFAGKEHHSPDCKKGCSWCCWQPVFALSYELDSLKAYLKENFSDEQLTHILERAAARTEKLKGLQGDDLLNSKSPCPLLLNGSCMAYAARPVACRIYLSTSVASCRKFYDNPADPDSIPQLMRIPIQTGRFLNEGFRAGLKAMGIATAELRIEEGLSENS